MDPFALPIGKFVRRHSQSEVRFPAGIQKSFQFLWFCGTEKWRYIVNGAFRGTCPELNSRVHGK